jgi:phage-related protein
MIRESLYFSFAGRKSIEFPIANVSIGSGLFEESLTSPKSIIETTVPYNNTPFFQGVKRDPKTIPLRFGFLEPWNDEMIDEIIRWLDKDYYQPLYFSSNKDRIFYAMSTDTIDQIHNGLKNGYVNITFRTKGSETFSPDIYSSVYKVEEETMIELDNLGHVDVFPEINLQKISDGDFTIINLSDNGEEFKFTGLKDNEELYINCQTRDIESSLPNTYRIDDFNDNYLKLVYGRNLLRIKGDCHLMFKYRYIYK